MDRTQDSGSCNEGSIPPERIVFLAPMVYDVLKILCERSSGVEHHLPKVRVTGSNPAVRFYRYARYEGAKKEVVSFSRNFFFPHKKKHTKI